MTDQLKQKIKDKIAKLPKEIEEVVNAFDWETEIENIGKKYLLRDEDIENLQIETSLILLGLQELGSYTSNIETNVGLSGKEAENINNDVVKNVFSPLLSAIAKKMNIDITTEEQTGDEYGNWESNVDYILDN